MADEKKKKGFLSYGKEEDEPEDKKKSDDSDDEEKSDEGAAEKRAEYLAEQTGVENPKALLKLIKHCMRG